MKFSNPDYLYALGGDNLRGGDLPLLRSIWTIAALNIATGSYVKTGARNINLMGLVTKI